MYCRDVSISKVDIGYRIEDVVLGGKRKRRE